MALENVNGKPLANSTKFSSSINFDKFSNDEDKEDKKYGNKF